MASSSEYSPASSGSKEKRSCTDCPAPSLPSHGVTANGGITSSEKRPSHSPELRSRKASSALARTGCSPKSTPSGKSKHGRGPRAETPTANFSRSVTHISWQW